MRSSLIALLALGVALWAHATNHEAAAQTEAPVLLRTQATVDEPVVRLGDLFDGLDERAATPVARAPAPGQRVEVGARWLAAVAQAYGVAWRPASNLEHSVIERSSIVVGPEQIERALRDALAERGLAGNVSLVLDNPALRLHLPSDAAPSVAVTGLSFDTMSGRFSAHVAAPAEGAPLARATLTGRAVALAEVPVLRRRVKPGEVIRHDDVEWIALRADHLGRDTVVDPANMVGKSPRRPLRPGETVRNGDLRAPILVAKNSLVTVVLETPRMVLTAQGRALEPGAEGEAIRVMNTKSNKVISAVVAESGTVLVLAEAFGSRR